MTLFFLLTIVLWLRYRGTGGRWAWWAANASFTAALGFKEPAACLPLLLLLWDLHKIRWDWKRALRSDFWRPYVGFIAVLLVFGTFVIWYPEGRLRVPDPYGTYGFHGFSKVALPWVRTWVNVLLPFSQPLSLRKLDLAHLALLGFVLLTLIVLQQWLRLGSALVVSIVATAILVLPTSMFVGAYNGDQYLYLPSFAVAAFLGCVAGELLRRGLAVRLGAITGMVLYVLFGALYLHNSGLLWAQAGDQAKAILSSVRSLVPPNQVSNLTLINVPKSNSIAPIMANGTRGALIAIGYSPHLQL